MNAKLNVLILGGLVLASLAAGLWLMPQSTPDIAILDDPIETLDARPAPDVYFTDIYDDAHHLDDFKGEVVLVNFWASWCAPCVAEMPQLLKLASKYQRRLRLILINVDSDPEKMRVFFKNQNLLPVSSVISVWDEDKKISKDVFGTIRYPESIIIDTSGRMVQKVSGSIDWMDANMQKNIERLLNQP